jgi:phosphocarrier protein HPr
VSASFSRDLDIINKRGLHARAAAKFVQTASRFDAEIKVSKDGSTVTGTSIMGLMMLAAAQGTSIHVEIGGTQAEEAMTAIAALIANRFEESE